MSNLNGKTATLKTPYKGYTNITLIEKSQYRWLVKTQSGLQFEVYEDEFNID